MSPNKQLQTVKDMQPKPVNKVRPRQHALQDLRLGIVQVWIQTLQRQKNFLGQITNCAHTSESQKSHTLTW
jgi:hypothetical protein